MLLIERFLEFGDREAIVWRDQSTTYDELHRQIGSWCEQLDLLGVRPGESVAVCGDYSPATTALLLALACRRCIVVPLAVAAGGAQDDWLRIAEVTVWIRFDGDQPVVVRRHDPSTAHPLLARLRRDGHAGLVLFSSGSTGTCKAILLDFDLLLKKMEDRAKAHRTLVFLVFGHIGGINTVMRTLAGGGTLVMMDSRQPAEVCAVIERHRVDLLPTTPTFLALLLMSGSYRDYNLESLRLITYGTESMPASTLHSLREVLPDVVLKQTYGMSELGILPTRSKSSESLYMKVGGDGFEVRVVDNVLWIRADTAMLGYLNAPSPFSEDGWFNTGDAVEADGDYLRILGRASELINVGGEKVYPAEVESVLLEIPNIGDALVFAGESPVTGNVVCARVTVTEPEDEAELRRRIKRYCRARLAPFKVPVTIEVSSSALHGSRYKKTRTAAVLAIP